MFDGLISTKPIVESVTQLSRKAAARLGCDPPPVMKSPTDRPPKKISAKPVTIPLTHRTIISAIISGAAMLSARCATG